MWRSLLLGTSSLLGFISKAHWLASLNNYRMCYWTITPLIGVRALNHIQTSMLDVLRELSSSCQMEAGTPLGLCCHIGGCPILDLKAQWPLRSGDCMHLVHKCMHIPCAYCRSNCVNNFSCFYEEWLFCGAQVEPVVIK